MPVQNAQERLSTAYECGLLTLGRDASTIERPPFTSNQAASVRILDLLGIEDPDLQPAFRVLLVADILQEGHHLFLGGALLHQNLPLGPLGSSGVLEKGGVFEERGILGAGYNGARDDGDQGHTKKSGVGQFKDRPVLLTAS